MDDKVNTGPFSTVNQHFTFSGCKFKELPCNMRNHYIAFTVIWSVCLAGSTHDGSLWGVLGCMGSYALFMGIASLFEDPPMWEVTYGLLSNYESDDLTINKEMAERLTINWWPKEPAPIGKIVEMNAGPKWQHPPEVHEE